MSGDVQAREAVAGWAWVGLGGLATFLIPVWLLLTASLIQFGDFTGVAESSGAPVVIVEIGEDGEERPLVWPSAMWGAGVSLLFAIPVGLLIGLGAAVTRVAMDRRAAEQRAALDQMIRDDAVIAGADVVARGATARADRSRQAVVLADAPTRVLAWLVDRGLLLVASMPLLLLNPFVLQRIRLPLPEGSRPFVDGLLAVSALLLTALLVVQLVGILRDGQSIGKRWFGIRIAMPTGEVPSGATSLVLRRGAITLLAILTALLFAFVEPTLTVVGALLWPTIDGLAWLGSDQRALHDQWAGTVVVKASSV